MKSKILVDHLSRPITLPLPFILQKCVINPLLFTHVLIVILLLVLIIFIEYFIDVFVLLFLMFTSYLVFLVAEDRLDLFISQLILLIPIYLLLKFTHNLSVGVSCPYLFNIEFHIESEN